MKKWDVTLTNDGIVFAVQVDPDNHHIVLSDQEMADFNHDLSLAVIKARAERIQSTLMHVIRMVGDRRVSETHVRLPEPDLPVKH